MTFQFTRRKALQAGSAILALPWLESLALGHEQSPPQRIINVCTSFGLYGPSFFPAKAGRDYEPSEYLQVLGDLRQHFTVFSGISHPDIGGDHASESCFLTSARHPTRPGFRNTVSLDVVAAQHVAGATRFPLLTLSTQDGSPLSYTPTGAGIPALSVPSQIYARMFLAGSQNDVDKELARLRRGRSMLDRMRERLADLSRSVSRHDQQQLKDYAEAVRDLEKQLVAEEAWVSRAKPKVDEPQPSESYPSPFTDRSNSIGRARVMLNLAKLAVQTDSTRVVSVFIRGMDEKPPIQGISEGHHGLSHHGQNPEKIKQLQVIEKLKMSALRDFLVSLRDTKEEGGSLLDSTQVLFGSNLGDASGHGTSNLPILLAGGGYKHNQHIAGDAASNTPLGKLFVSMLQKFGMETDKFGSGSGTITELSYGIPSALNSLSSDLTMRCVIVFVVLLAATGAALAEDAAAVFQQRVMPILKTSCIDCHGGNKPEAQLNLDGPRTPEQLGDESSHWFRVLERIEAGTMPPEDAEPLPAADKKIVADWIRGEYTSLLLEQQRQVGRSKLRRLSRNEYANTVQDIFGIRPPVVRLLPGDGRVNGYDKVSAALPFSAAATEGHLQIAEELVARMFELPSDKTNFRLWSGPSEQSAGHVLVLKDDWHVSFNTDTTSSPLKKGTGLDGKDRNGFPGPRKPGRHRLRMSVYGYQTDKPLTVGIYVGHVWAYPQILNLIGVVEVPPAKPSIVEAEVYLRTGRDSDGPSDDGIRLIPFGLGVPVPKNTQASDCKGPGLAVQWIDVEELDETLPGQRLLTSDMPPAIRDAFARSLALKASGVSRDELAAFVPKKFSEIGARLFRRDLTDVELARSVNSYLAAVDADVPLKTAFIEEVTAMLVAPDFLCVMEQPGRLSDFALASRLSYFLWNSAPDEELLRVAREGKLSDSQILRAQTDRLLQDRKSQRFVKDFLDQWLGLWGIDNTTPDKDIYPEYDDVLKISSMLETQATFRHMLDKNRSVRDFVAPEWAMINARLAAHYGIAGVEGFQVREVRLPAESPYGGIWTQAATMKVTANGTLTSPVKRGVWVAERLLGNTIPPPPPNIKPVDPDTRGAKTLREQLALHSGEGSCVACHAKFDPYGFALESFDVMGGFRQHYRLADSAGERKWKDGLPVDCSGTTPAGKPFTGVQELRQQLALSPAQLARGVTRHLVTYSTSEPTTPLDQPAIDAIVESAAKDDYGLRSLVHGVIQSELFRSK